MRGLEVGQAMIDWVQLRLYRQFYAGLKETILWIAMTNYYKSINGLSMQFINRNDNHLVECGFYQLF